MRAGIAAAIVVFFAGHASAQVPVFADREARREAALRTSAEALVPMRDYRQGTCADPDQTMRSDCVRAGHDANHLVAALELDRLGVAGGMTPAEAAPIAMHIAEAAHALVGTEAAQCRCSWDQAGNPSIMYAAQSLGYALHEFGADLDGGAPPPDAGTPIDAATSADAARPPEDGTVDGGCGCVVVRPTFGPTSRTVWLAFAAPLLAGLTMRRRRRCGAAGR